MHRLPDSAARHELVHGPRHIKAITGEYCKTEYAIPIGTDCGHVYHYTLPRHHLVPAELFEMI
jgi:hypothetical protein